MAVNRVTLMPKNPLSGLNAIGGAVSLDVKNGFNYRCEEAEVRGRSFGRAGVDAQAGVQKGNYSAYMTADSIHDDGWRDFSSSSELNGIYAGLGARGGDQTESRLQFTGAIDNLGAVAAPPEHCSSSVGRPSIPGRRPRIFSWLSSKRPAVGRRPTRSRCSASATIAVSGKATLTATAPTGSRVIRADLSRCIDDRLPPQYQSPDCRGPFLGEDEQPTATVGRSRSCIMGR